MTALAPSGRVDARLLLRGTRLVAGLAWLAHIAIDRGLGFGPRTPDGWQRG